MFDIYRRISVMGSTGSVGTQTLETVRDIEKIKGKGFIEITGLSAGSNYKLLAEQALRFNVRSLCVATEEGASYLRSELKDLSPEIYVGEKGLCDFARIDTDLLVTAIVGMRGLLPTLEAIKKGTHIALANKETLVTGGEIVMPLARKNKCRIIPVDSEHAAVFKCLHGHKKREVSKIILTASGGPFRGYTKEQISKVGLSEALSHPTWKMGRKITIDCATMMNKGLEVIEASRLFGFSGDMIEVLIHPESIIHSMVEWKDGSVTAELSKPDMKIPIIQAISYPERVDSLINKTDFTKISGLTFEKPDFETFGCLKIAY